MGGYALGVQQAEQDRARQFARRDQLSDGDRKQKAGDYVTARNNALTNLPNLKDLYGEDSQQYKDALQTIQQSQYNLGQLYHPDKAPGALQKDWHWLLGKMHGITAPKDQTPSSITTQTPAFTPPAAPFTTQALPAYEQVTPVLSPQGEPLAPPPASSGSSLPVWNTGGKGRIGSVATQVPGVPSVTLPPMSTAVPKGATPTMAVAKPKGLVEAGNIPIWNRPSVLNDDGTHSSELSISMQDDKGNEVLIPLIVDGKFLTPNGKMPAGDIPHNAQEWEKASPEWKALRMQAWKHYEQTGQHLGKFDNPDDTDAYAQVLHNRGSATANAIPAGPPVTVTKAPAPTWGQAQVLKQKAAAMQKAQQEAGVLAAGAPLSPQEQAGVDSATSLAKIQGAVKNFKAINPTATDEEVSAYANTLLPGYASAGNWERIDGTDADGKPVSISYDKKRAVYKMEDGSLSPTLPKGFIPTSKSENSRPVPYYAGAVNLDTARQLGAVYNGKDGKPYDLSSLPEGSVLIPVYEGGGKSYWSVATDKGRYETGDNLRKFEPAVGAPNPDAPNVGQARVPTARTSVTPGPNGPVTTTSVTSPVTGASGASRPAAVRQAIPNHPSTHPVAPRSGGVAQPAAQVTPPKQTSSSDVPPMRDPKLPPMKGADERAIASIAAPVATVEQQVVGRGVKPLWEYSNVLNNPDLLKAVNLAMAAPMIQTPEGSKDPGFWETVTRGLGLVTAAQQITTDQIVAARNKVQKEGGPQAVEFLDRLSELKGTIPNLRKIQGGSSAMGAMQPLYQESPIMNISSPDDFRNRIANMLRTMAIALDQTPGINKAHINWLYGQADQAQANSRDVLKMKAAILNAPPPPPAQFKVGDPVMIGNKQVTIKKINPDGTFDY